MPRGSRRWSGLWFGTLFLAPLAAQQRNGLPAGVGREQMWYAPTAEDWAKPCLIQWQRSYEDALALSEGTGKPILVCVNMDGEIASEHYAGVCYRQPEIAALYQPYVCVIASVYRHTARDYDELGRRIPCPRFGTVTCGEHIAIEPVLYEKYFEGKRIAPRHIGLELDRAEMYDVYYAWDTDSVFQAIRGGIAGRPEPLPLARGDLALAERVASRDSADRAQVEDAYAAGDDALRRTLLESALALGGAAPLDLLRLGLADRDQGLRRLARRALAQTVDPAATDLIVEAMRGFLEAPEREALVGALARLGESSPRARTLALVYCGLAADAGALDVAAWAQSLDGAPAAAYRAWSQLESELDAAERTAAGRPADAASQLQLAEAALALAVDPATAQNLGRDRKSASQYSRLQFEDARHAAVAAAAAGATGWRVEAVLALCDYYLGDVAAAYRRAVAAAGALPPGEQSWNAMAMLSLFAAARRDAIAAAQRDQKDWPAQWLTDVHAAYSVLARHPLASDALFAAQHDFLKSLGARGPAAQALDEGLARFPDSWALHERFRARILAEQGLAGLEPAYEALLAKPEAPRNLEWFAGYASLTTAEFQRRAGAAAEALAAYDRAIAHYERSIAVNSDTEATADHYVALALAGRARLALEAGDFDGALRQLLASFARKPEAADTHDGLGLSPVATAKTLLARLHERGLWDQASRLREALQQLDPKQLELPAYERELPPGR